MVNILKLYKELETAGLPIVGVNGDGKIAWSAEPTEEQLASAKSIVDNHNPEDVDELRRREYPPLVTQLEGIYKTLRFVESQGINLGPDAEAWMSKIEDVKRKYPKE